MFDVLHEGMSFNSDDRVGWKILKGLQVYVLSRGRYKPRGQHTHAC